MIRPSINYLRVRRYICLVPLTVLAQVLFLWRDDVNYIRFRFPNIHQEEDKYFSRSRHGDLVDEAFEKTLYDSLTDLTFDPPHHSTIDGWPKMIWQTSPYQGTKEMETWKVNNPEWGYKVS